MLFLPFYIMRYEKTLDKMKEDTEEKQVLFQDYEDIRIQLDKLLAKEDKNVLYSDMATLVVKIADYVLRQEMELKEGIGDIMRGKVLELPSDKLRAEQRAIGEQMLGKLIDILLNEGRTADARLAATNEEARKEFYKKYGIID